MDHEAEARRERIEDLKPKIMKKYNDGDGVSYVMTWLVSKQFGGCGKDSGDCVDVAGEWLAIYAVDHFENPETVFDVIDVELKDHTPRVFSDRVYEHICRTQKPIIYPIK